VRVRPPSVFEEGLPPNGAVIVLYAARNGMIVQADPALFYSSPSSQATMTASQPFLTDANRAYCTFTVNYTFGDDRIYLRANNGYNVTIEDETGGNAVRPRSVPPTDPSHNGYSTLRFALQEDGTFKIYRNTGYYVDVNMFGALVSATAMPGDTGKFNWMYASPVTGKITSYNPGVETTVRLMQDGAVKYKTAIAKTSGYGQQTQSFTFPGVAPGDYTLVVTKPGHTSFTVQKITVGNTGLDLTLDSRAEVKEMVLLCGDINGDGMINDSDLAELWRAANYNKSVDDAGVNQLCDLNGDGMINDSDLAILWSANNYNKGAVVVG